MNKARICTFYEAKSGGWKKFTETVEAGRIRLLVSRRPRVVEGASFASKTEPNLPIAAAVPAGWAREVEAEHRTKPARWTLISSYHARQELGPLSQQINESSRETKPEHYVIRRGKRAAHQRRYTAGVSTYTTQAAGYEGDHETLALVSIPWLARALGATEKTLEEFRFDPHRYSDPFLQ